MYSYEIIGSDNHDEFEAFVKSHPKGHMLQTWEWSKQKSFWLFQGIVVRDESGEIKGAMSVLIRRIPLTPWTLMYAARGPVCDINDREMLACLLDGAKELAKKHRSYVLKLDPDVTFEETTFMAHMKDLGFVLAPKAPNFENIQPQYVMRLPIEARRKKRSWHVQAQDPLQHPGSHQKRRRSQNLRKRGGQRFLPDYGGDRRQRSVHDTSCPVFC